MLTANAIVVINSNKGSVEKVKMLRFLKESKRRTLNGEIKEWRSRRLILSDGTEIDDFRAKIEGSFSRKVEGSDVEEFHIILTGGVIINFDDASRRALAAVS